MDDFRNEPFTDFSRDEERSAMLAALEKVRGEFGRHYPIIIGGEEILLDETYDSTDPNNPKQLLGKLSKGSVKHAQQALEAATEAFETWKRVPARERAGYLFEVARLMRERKHYYSAWMVYEVGKSWPEADADTAEAIDFLEYYGRQMILLEEEASSRLVHHPDERNELFYIPLGVGAIIPPWNFANAILVGMTSAGIVGGNSVVVKPAGQSSVIAYHALDLFREVGLPAGVLNFLTGPGSTTGEALVDSPLTRFIAFTGSREVGTRIYERASRVHEGQKWLKRTASASGRG